MKRNKHNLSHYKLLSCDQGHLVPIMAKEVLPGDTWQHSTSAFIRVSPLATPVMHPVRARIHHFFVPYRLLWDSWEDFITGGSDGLNASVYPTITTTAGTGFAVGSLGDYLGVTPLVPDEPVSALPFRAYGLIYNEFYRDQDLNSAVTVSTADGADTTTNVALKAACWERDRFTLSRATPQKGAAVTLPIGTSAPVLGIGPSTQSFPDPNVTVYESDGTSSSYANARNANTTVYLEGTAASGGSAYPNIRADLSAATAATISELRTAFALQQYAENRSLYGSRYTDYLAFLGVKSSDARLQRPEYLGGGVQTIQFSEVVQTAEGATDPLGTLGGHGAGALKSNKYRRFFEEHGIVISLLSVLPKTMYAQGLERMWNRRTKEDFFQAELQFVGQEEVQNKEVYLAAADPEATWGYIDRYDDYRRAESSIAGEFRTTLDSWHMARIFASEPALNSTFVTANPTDRIYADTATNELQVMVNHRLFSRRIVAKTGTPRSF